MRAQNGRRLTLRPAVRNSKCAKHGKRHRHPRRRHHSG
jgi:hypothetical protein